MHKVLESIGLSPSESKVYLASIDHPHMTITQLIKSSKVSRAKVYEVIERLRNKGLISISIKNNKKHIQALSPKRLLDLIKQEEETIALKKSALKKILPRLAAQQKQNTEEVMIFEGISGIRSFFDHMKDEVTDKTIIRGIAFDRPNANKSIRTLFHEFQKERAHKGGKTYILCNDQNQLPNKKRKYVYEKNYVFKVIDGKLPTGLQIYNDNVAIFTWSPPKVILINSKENAEYYSTFFDSLWNKK